MIDMKDILQHESDLARRRTDLYIMVLLDLSMIKLLLLGTLDVRRCNMSRYHSVLARRAARLIGRRSRALPFCFGAGQL